MCIPSGVKSNMSNVSFFRGKIKHARCLFLPGQIKYAQIISLPFGANQTCSNVSSFGGNSQICANSLPFGANQTCSNIFFLLGQLKYAHCLFFPGKNQICWMSLSSGAKSNMLNVSFFRGKNNHKYPTSPFQGQIKHARCLFLPGQIKPAQSAPCGARVYPLLDDPFLSDTSVRFLRRDFR